MNAPSSASPATPAVVEVRRAGFGQTAAAVFWSFFGVRKRADYEADAAQLNPVHVIVMGVIGAALFVATLLAIIRFVVLG
jgi:hypothetical protein